MSRKKRLKDWKIGRGEEGKNRRLEDWKERLEGKIGRGDGEEGKRGWGRLEEGMGKGWFVRIADYAEDAALVLNQDFQD